MSLACVFAIFWYEGECAATPWIFVNLNTSNAADLRHQNEDSVTAFKSRAVHHVEFFVGGFLVVFR